MEESGSFHEPNPRKGTETAFIKGSRQTAEEAFHEPNPRKGTETCDGHTPASTNTKQTFHEPNPRKGTETQVLIHHRVHQGYLLSTNLIPARGLKQDEQSWIRELLKNGFPRT